MCFFFISHCPKVNLVSCKQCCGLTVLFRFQNFFLWPPFDLFLLNFSKSEKTLLGNTLDVTEALSSEISTKCSPSFISVTVESTRPSRMETKGRGRSLQWLLQYAKAGHTPVACKVVSFNDHTVRQRRVISVTVGAQGGVFCGEWRVKARKGELTGS